MDLLCIFLCLNPGHHSLELSEEYCDNFFLRNFGSGLWTKKLHLTFHPREGK